MQKSSASTSLQTSVSSNSKTNQAYLMDLVRNLELELGYHTMAFKKAEKMIKLLQNQNDALKDQNKQLKSKCLQLEVRLVQYENQLSKFCEAYSPSHIGCVSNKRNKQMYVQPPEMMALSLKSSISNHSKAKRVYKQPIEPETVKHRKSTQQLTQSNRLINNYEQQNSLMPVSPLKNRNKKGASITKNTVQSLSFIPFQQLQLQTKWR